MALSDEGSFEKDEWGPWKSQVVEHTNIETGRVESVSVLRSDLDGVDLMHKYPTIALNPGVEPWKDESAWKRDKVFADLAKWTFTGSTGGELHLTPSASYLFHPTDSPIPHSFPSYNCQVARPMKVVQSGLRLTSGTHHTQPPIVSRWDLQSWFSLASSFQHRYCHGRRCGRCSSSTWGLLLRLHLRLLPRQHLLLQ